MGLNCFLNAGKMVDEISRWEEDTVIMATCWRRPAPEQVACEGGDCRPNPRKRYLVAKKSCL